MLVRRFLRILFTAITLLSFFIFLTATFFWVRSNYILDDFSYLDSSPEHRSSYSIAFRSLKGYQLLTWNRRSWNRAEDFERDQEFREEHRGFNYRARESGRSGWFFWDRQRLRIAFDSIPTHPSLGGAGTLSGGSISFPPWFFPGLSAILPLLWLRRRFLRSRRARDGLCSSCGYDMRSTPEQCPECGATPAGAST